MSLRLPNRLRPLLFLGVVVGAAFAYRAWRLSLAPDPAVASGTASG